MDDRLLISPKIPKIRHRCIACYKMFNRREHLVEHMKISYHSVHQPKCGVCLKHCKSFESSQTILKGNCKTIFSRRGCCHCLQVFEDAIFLVEHRKQCYLSPPIPLVCEMVGGDVNGSKDLCASVCLVDENVNVIFSTQVQPQLPVTDYRHEVTGLTEEDLKDGMPLQDVREKVLVILCDGHYDGTGRLLLVGHDLKHHMKCLNLQYPSHLLRDTAKYESLMKTILVRQSLKYLTRSYLGYKIQCGKHDPYEDCVSAMRLYNRMRDQDHGFVGKAEVNGLNSWKQSELEKMTPEELYHNSTLEYRCWCLDKLNNL